MVLAFAVCDSLRVHDRGNTGHTVLCTVILYYSQCPTCLQMLQFNSIFLFHCSTFWPCHTAGYRHLGSSGHCGLCVAECILLGVRYVDQN